MATDNPKPVKLPEALKQLADRWQRVGESPALQALNKTFDRWQRVGKSPEFQRFCSKLEQVASSLSALQRNPRVVEVLGRLPEWQRNLEAHKTLLEQAIATLEQSPYKAVWDVFAWEDLLTLGQLSKHAVDQEIFRRTALHEFADELVQMYEQSALRQGRSQLIREALTLHSSESFGGSVTLLYSQIEGIIGDALIPLGLAQFDDNGILYTCVGSSGDKSKKLHGLRPKLDEAINTEPSSDLASLYENLKTGCLLVDSVELGISPSRNGVLHGSNLKFATREHSTQLVLWLAALLVIVSSAPKLASSLSTPT